MFLQLLPESTQMDLLRKHPNLRKAAPQNLKLRFDAYLGEFKVNIDTRFKIERIMWTGRYEPELLHLLGQWVQPDSICFDVGANVGAISLAMAQRLKGGSGRVYSFEPAPGNFARFQANVALNPSVQPHIVPVNCGVGQQPGTLNWTEEPGNAGNGTLVAGSGIAVPVITVDAFCAEREVTRIDVMKIDVESMEYEVLCGAKESLRRWRPKLYFETMSRSKDMQAGDIFQKIEDLLRGLGYELFRLNRQRELVPTDARHLADYTIAIAKPNAKTT